MELDGKIRGEFVDLDYGLDPLVLPVDDRHLELAGQFIGDHRDESAIPIEFGGAVPVVRAFVDFGPVTDYECDVLHLAYPDFNLMSVVMVFPSEDSE